MKESFAIVVTDRNRNVRDLLQRELSAEGYRVRVAANRGEVLQAIARPEEVDLVVLDLDLLRAEGSGLNAEWQAAMAAPQAPLILLHAFMSEDLMDTGELLERACALVEKSGDLEPLKRMVRRVLGQRCRQRGSES